MTASAYEQIPLDQDVLVRIGSHVAVVDLDDASSEEFDLVPSADSDLFAGRISNESPVGRALEGRHAGETIEVHARTASAICGSSRSPAAIEPDR
jgi:transcription elongation GreA/GreB family factor